MRRFPSKGDLQRSGSGKGVRISAPFDFQHVAKIEDSVDKPLGLEGPEFFDNFRTLERGHRNAVIAPPSEEEEDEAEEEQDVDAEVKARRAPPPRPQRPDDLWDCPPKSAPLPQVEERYLSATYIDQPKSAGFRGTIPGRRSSIAQSTGSLMNGPGPTMDSETGMHNLDSFDDYDAFIPLYESQPVGWIENSLPLLHTVSPIETYGDHHRTPAFNPPLEQVPEEPEGTFSNRPSRDLARRPSLRHSKSTPVIASRFRTSVNDGFSIDDLPLPL